MERRNDNPGAVQYGNFMNYYQFHSASDRLKLLPSNIWLPDSNQNDNDEPYLVLDVGCNAGNFTQLLPDFLTECTKRPVYILGVDIDPRLVERAQLANTCQNIEYACLDVMDNEIFQQKVRTYLKQYKRSEFDVICCYSITMWIHLNHNDTGLQCFLEKLSELAKLFVVEPQPWKCYQTAERRLKITGEVFPLFRQLKWRSDVEVQIENYLERNLKQKKIFETEPTKWQRRICFYRKHELEKKTVL